MALIQTLNINLDLARVGIEAAINESVSRGRRCCIAVVDSAGNLVSFDRVDRAPLQSTRLAQDKACSVAANGLANDEFWELIKDDPCLVSGAQKINGLIWLGGGIPILHESELIGAIGISGDGGMADDKAIAAAGVEAIQRVVRHNSDDYVASSKFRKRPSEYGRTRAVFAGISPSVCFFQWSPSWQPLA